MNTYIALLRGINVGGHKKILMADLRALLETSGLNEVSTYIQSGNVIFKSEASAKECSENISEAILEKYGWEVPILIKTPSEIKSILENCPFPQVEKEKSYFMLLQMPPLAKNIKSTLSFQFPNEKFSITPQCVYLFSSVGLGKSKMSNNFFERKLKVNTTTRNFKTMVKLIELSD